MENFVVAVFANYEQARLAADELERSGFAPADVQLTPEAGLASGGQWGAGTAMPDDEDDASHSLCVLSIEAGDDQRRGRAMEIVERFAPLDVDQRVSHWTDEGWKSESEPSPGSMARRAAGEGVAPPAHGGGHRR